MKTFIIVRHAAFSHADPQVADVNHPLTRAGRYQALAAAKRFASFQIKPDLIICSEAKRAVETAEVYAEVLGLSSDSMQVEEGVFEAERAEILRIIHRQDDSNEIIMLVGHNPGITFLLHHLVDSDVAKMPTSSFAVVELAINRWHQASFKNAKLIHFSAPEVREAHHGWWWRFTFWRRQRMQKVELFVVFLVGLLLILGVITLIVMFSTDPAGLPQQGSMGH